MEMICIIAQFFQLQLNAPLSVQATPKQVLDMANFSAKACEELKVKKKKDQNELDLKTQKEKQDEKAALGKK